MKKTFKIDDLDITVKEAVVGDIIQLCESYVKTCGVDVKMADMVGLFKNSEALLDVANLVKALPMVEQLVNQLVIISNDGGSDLTYRDLSLSQVQTVLKELKEVNQTFFGLAQMAFQHMGSLVESAQKE